MHGRFVVLIPTYNEAYGIGPTLEEIRKVFGDISCLVVDRSTDDTSRIAERHGAKVVAQTGKGKGAAVIQGLGELKDNARYVVMTDGDYTYPVEAVRKFLTILDEDPNIGMVTGNRFGSSPEPGIKAQTFYVGNKIIALIHNLLSLQGMADPLTGLRAFRAEIFRGWRPSSKGFDIEVEMNMYVSSKGYRIHEVPIMYRERLGKKKLGLRDAFPILLRVLKVGLWGIKQSRSPK